MGLEIDCLTLRRLLLKVAAINVSSAPTMSIFQSSMLVSQVHMMHGWAKRKEKVPDVSDPNQNAETRSHSKLKFT